MDIKKILFKTSEIDVEKALPDAVVFCNKDGKILWVNDKAAELFETSKMHLLTSNISDFIENPINLISNSLISGDSVITKLLTKEVYFDMTTKEIAEGFVLDFRDAVSQQPVKTEKTIEEVKTINRDKNNFLIKLANDFKSPLQSIVGFSQAMTDGLGGEMSEQQDKYIKIIKKNSSDLMYFINKLIELSQTEVDLKTPEYKKFDVLNTINSQIRYNEQLYKSKNIRSNVILDENMKSVIVSDEEIFKTIFQNVLEVVIRAIDMGEMNIQISQPDAELISSKGLPNIDYVMISISTNALLLSESDLESMFDPYKIIDTTNRKNLLRAMTLACVKNLVQSLKGIVWVESQILKNTSFNLIIPSNNN
ncbi:MAG: PAS domain-containing sensor histidine kinase [Cyanobacteria bacterium SIG28]|nr:PAS domain-containing sensor histidine kinase [Cyanobacteria bacterium SIG28]